MRVVHAVAAHRLDDRRSAVELLTRAADTARATGAWRPFTIVPRRDLIALAEDIPALADWLGRHNFPDVFPEQVDVIDLTRREQEVLERVDSGLSMHQVANALRVSYSTVRTQQRSLYRKLSVDSQPDAVARARALGLLLAPES